VPEPESNHAAVDACFEELDGGSVTQNVGIYVLVDQSWARSASGSGMLFDEPFDGVAAQGAAATTGEQRLSGSSISVLEPVPKYRDGLRS
jgi:hypothetical protein